MNKEEIIEKTAGYVRQELEGEGSGHDWWHVYIVWQNAKHIGKEEGADMFIVELAALLHDIADWKIHDGDEDIGPRKAGEWLESLDINGETIEHIKQIIKMLSFKGAGVKDEMDTVEGKVVQDADRLDAIGAIGIARAFVFAGKFGEIIYDPGIAPSEHKSKEEYISESGKTTAINYFYEKLFLLKDRIKTDTGRNIAQERHEFMEEYLERFYNEWEGEK